MTIKAANAMKPLLLDLWGKQESRQGQHCVLIWALKQQHSQGFLPKAGHRIGMPTHSSEIDDAEGLEPCSLDN